MSPTDQRSPQRTASRRTLLLGAVVAVAGLRLQAPGALAQDRSSCAADDPKCTDREARRFLNLGDAEAAVNNIPQARYFWQRAIEVGIASGSQAAVMAQKRLQMYTLTCSYSDESLAELSNVQHGHLVNNRVYQNALAALGYYQGPLDGQLSVLMRSAIRKFQRDMAFDETDTLEPRQIVYLICNGAETARDASSQTTLALMYAAGVGVEQSTNFALAWFRMASARAFATATFYLAILYGTGHCGFSQSLDYADQYLKEACQQKHKLALKLVQLYGAIPDPTSRWAKIGADPAVQECLEIIGKKCPAPRYGGPRRRGPPGKQED